MNSEWCKQALGKVVNPNVLVNLISRRVRQLNSGGGSASRPLITNAHNLSPADIALLEIVDDKMGWEIPLETHVLTEPTPRKRKKS